MSRLDSRQLDELVQATVELQNRPQQERRMQTVAFTAQVDERELDGLDSQTRVETIEARWQHLNHQMATYIAENLSANQYQLLRAARSQQRDPMDHRTILLTLTLEVGQVTERSFVNVMTWPLTYTYPNGRGGQRSTVRREDVVNVERAYGPEPGSLQSVVPTEDSSGDVASSFDREVQRRQAWFNQQMAAATLPPPQSYVTSGATQGIPQWIEENASIETGVNTNSPPSDFRNWTGSYASPNNEQIRAALDHARQRTQALEAVTRSSDGEVIPWRGWAEEISVATTPPAPKPDPVPHKRHILIDMKDKQ